MALLDIQRRGQQIGRLRIGQQVQASNGKMRPARLDTFRFTTASRQSAEAIAALYGGKIRDWEGQFEVITNESAIGVMVPPRDAVISQWYEMWSKGGCQRRCDSQHEQISNGPCLCPHAEDPEDVDEVARCALERAGLASQNPPKACKIVTRISVQIPDLPGVGVFRLDTGSYYAASEIGDAAAIMQMARDQGVFLAAVLRIEHRSRVAGGQTKKFPVPVLEITSTFRQIASGELAAGGITAQLPPAPGEQPKAITAGTKDLPGPRSASHATDEGSRSQAVPVRAGEPEMTPAPPPAGPSDDAEDEPWQLAQRLAERALRATSPAELRAAAEDAERLGVAGEHICTDRQNDTWEEFLPWWRELWRERARGVA